MHFIALQTPHGAPRVLVNIYIVDSDILALPALEVMER